MHTMIVGQWVYVKVVKIIIVKKKNDHEISNSQPSDQNSAKSVVASNIALKFKLNNWYLENMFRLFSLILPFLSIKKLIIII